QVHGDDGGAAGDMGGHDGGEPDGADAEDDDARTGVGMQRVEHRPGPGLDATAEGAEELQRRAAVDLHHVALVGQGVVGEGRLPEEVPVDGGATVGDGGRLVRPEAAEVQVVEAGAVRRRAFLAGDALAAGHEAHHHVV